MVYLSPDADEPSRWSVTITAAVILTGHSEAIEMPKRTYHDRPQKRDNPVRRCYLLSSGAAGLIGIGCGGLAVVNGAVSTCGFGVRVWMPLSC